jgi:hypothetical protein
MKLLFPTPVFELKKEHYTYWQHWNYYWFY